MHNSKDVWGFSFKTLEYGRQREQMLRGEGVLATCLRSGARFVVRLPQIQSYFNYASLGDLELSFCPKRRRKCKYDLSKIHKASVREKNA